MGKKHKKCVKLSDRADRQARTCGTKKEERFLKNSEIIQKMTLEEKAALLSGKGEWQTWNFDRLGIPSMYCSDGPHGIRKQAGAGDHLGLNPSLPATCFRTAATMANSWDPSWAKRSEKRSARKLPYRASMSCWDRDSTSREVRYAEETSSISPRIPIWQERWRQDTCGESRARAYMRARSILR